MMENQEQQRSGAYQWDLDNQLLTDIAIYEDDRTKYWQSRLDAEEWSALNELRCEADEIARLIRQRALALSNVGDISELNNIYRLYHERMDQARERYAACRQEQLDMLKVLEQRVPNFNTESYLQFIKRELGEPDPEAEGDDPLRLVWERLCIDDVRDTVDHIRDRVSRVFELERLIYEELGKEIPSDSVVSYLTLISRTYIYGFDAECVVMCRSAMENALRNSVSDEDLERSGRHKVDLDSLICAAFHKENCLLHGDPNLYRAAQQVQFRGNKAAHSDPDATKDILGTIRSALQVVDALSDLPRANGQM